MRYSLDETCLRINNRHSIHGPNVTGFLYNINVTLPACQIQLEELDVYFDLKLEIRRYQPELDDGELLHDDVYQRIICNGGEPITLLIQPPLLVIGMESALNVTVTLVNTDASSDNGTLNDNAYYQQDAVLKVFGILHCETTCILDDHLEDLGSCPNDIFIPELQATTMRLDSIMLCLRRQAAIGRLIINVLW